jgi:hypothetical protein
MQKKHLVLAAVILILILAGGIFLRKDPSQSQNPTASAATADEAKSQSEKSEMIEVPKGSAGIPSGSSMLVPPSQLTKWNPEVKEKLKAFQALQVKSVMTAAEEEARLQYLQDADLIAQVSASLRSRGAQNDPQAEENQNTAIDVLIEALKEGNEQAATDAIWDQIRDNQVEDASIPLKERKVFAGIKGELLYHATALRPDVFQDVEMDLPGPVSQKIWRNVQAQHESNLEGSQAEVDEHIFNQQQSGK